MLASGVYTNSSKKAEFYSMELIIGSKINVNTLVAHHKKDACKVTQFKHAKIFMISLRPQENTFLYLTEAFQLKENVGHSIIMDLKKLRKI